MSVAAIGIGSNLGDPAANVRKAADLLASAGEISALSRLYESDPWGPHDQPRFVNAVALMETNLSPRALLEALKTIETEMGRAPTFRWGPRIIDLDIIYYDDLELVEPDLTIPHRHFMERPFVLVPLSEVDSRYAAAASPYAQFPGLRALE